MGAQAGENDVDEGAEEEEEEEEAEEEEEGAAATPTAAGEGAAPLPGGLHHLTRHWLPETDRGEAVLQRLGADSIKAAEHMIK